MHRIDPERKRGPFGGLILIVFILVAAILVGRFDVRTSSTPGLPFSTDRMGDLPKIIFWAWERPEELGFINPREVGVAFLAKTLYLREDKVVVRPRLQPLSVPNGTILVAVVRIESDRSEPPSLSSGQRLETVSEISELSRIPAVAAIQIDFDAKASERVFYRDLIYGLRRQLPDSIKLSITSLASWCIHDNWLNGLPIDEAVPMLFRMGVDHRRVLIYLQSGKDFRPAVCRHSIGISTDEPIQGLPSERRTYIFNPAGWSVESVRDIIKETNR